MIRVKPFICPMLMMLLLIIGCKENNQSNTNEEVQTLIREMLNWADSDDAISLTPLLTDSGNQFYTGFDWKEVDHGIDELKKTNFFSEDFIENYREIILTIERKLKNKEYGPWQVGDMPPFVFASNYDPWCLCQDIPYDNPSPWDHIEIDHLGGQTYEWKWGGIKADAHPSWEEHGYKFRVVNENSKWVISYLEGFDLDEVN